MHLIIKLQKEVSNSFEPTLNLFLKVYFYSCCVEGALLILFAFIKKSASNLYY